MRRFWLLAGLALAGCRPNYPAQVVGTWRIVPGTALSSRLTPGSDKKPDWTDATRALTGVKVHFLKHQLVTAEAYGLTSSAQWKMRGPTIEVTGANSDRWPDMVFDPRGPRIHATWTDGSDRLQWDLVKSD